MTKRSVRRNGAANSQSLFAQLVPVFDLAYYNVQARAQFDLAQALENYLTAGEAEGLFPHPLFDPSFVATQLRAAGREAGGCILLAYLEWDGGPIDPHPLFDSRYYRDRLSGGGRSRCDLVDYVERCASGELRLSPHPLFDADFYCDRYGDFGSRGVDALRHYVLEGASRDFQPHPLFRLQFWREALQTLEIEIEASASLRDYVLRPETWGVSPYPLFDPAYFTKWLRARGVAPDRGRPPLSDLLSRDETAAPHYLFDPEHYRRQAEISGVAFVEHPLHHYAANTGELRFNPHPLFDEQFYINQVGSISEDPAEHYLTFGWREERDPCPLFSQRHYREALPETRKLVGDPLAHYLKNGGQDSADPHPFFESRLYAASFPDAAQPPLSHYVRAWLERGFHIPPWGTLVEPRRGFSRDIKPFDIIVASHELSLTGAPLILLRIVEHLAKRHALRVLVLSAAGGPLRDAFAEWATVVDFSELRSGGAGEEPLMQWLVRSLCQHNRPKLALVNTVCIPRFATAFDAAGIPTLTLVHELASGFPYDDFRAVFEASRVIVFSARYALEEAHRTYPLPSEKSVVIPQGLLDPRFGEGDALAARAELIAEIGAPADAFVVLGCGTLDLRKGIDLFARLAAATDRCSRPKASARPIRFVWIGDGPTHPHSPVWYAKQDLVRSGHVENVHFLGSRAEPQRYFLACDAFALTSRMDPFPCVVHEAMACGKPVVAFENAGGAPEALADGAGVTVVFGDVEAMAQAICGLVDDPARARRMGARGRSRVRTVYDFSSYVEALLAAARERIGVEFSPTAPQRGERGRVVFTLAGDESDPQSTFVDRLAEGLAERGFRTEVVLTGGRNGAFDPLGAPKAPFRWLGRTLRSSTKIVDRAKSLEASLRAAAPAVLVPSLDIVGSSITPVVPKSVGVLGLIYDNQPAQCEQALRLARYWQRVVAPPAVAQQLEGTLPEVVGRAIPIGIGVPDWAAELDVRTPGPLPVACIWTSRNEQEWAEFLRLAADRPDPGGPSYILVLIHPANQLARIENLFAESIATSSICLVSASSIAEVRGALASCATLLCSSHTKMPVEFAEAMGLGLPLMFMWSASANEAPPALREGVNGFKVSRSEPERARFLLRDLARSHKRLAALRSSAQASGAAAFDRLEAVCDRYADLFDEMLADLNAKRYARPEPPYLHPQYGGLSLPPVSYVDLDAAYGLSTDEKPERAHGLTQFGWTPAAVSDDGAAEAKPTMEISLSRPTSRRLMVNVEVQAQAEGEIAIYSRTLFGEQFAPEPIVVKLSPGRNDLRVELMRERAIELIRITPSPSAAISVRSATVFEPAGVQRPSDPVLSLVKIVDVTAGGNGERYLGGDWYPPEATLRWSRADGGDLRFTAEFAEQSELRLWSLCRVVGTSSLGEMLVNVRLADGSKIADWRFPDDGWRLQSIPLLPSSSSRVRHLTFRLAPERVHSPLQLGLGSDSRQLGVAVKAIALFSAETPETEIAAAFRRS